MCRSPRTSERDTSWGRPPPAAASSRVHAPAWRDKPCWYLVTGQDRAIDPDLQREMAAKIGASVKTLASGHLPMISQPEKVAMLIDEAADLRQSELRSA